MISTEVEPVYLVRNHNGSLDTMVCEDRRLILMAQAIKGPQSLVRVPFETNLDLCSEELSFQYHQSNN